MSDKKKFLSLIHKYVPFIYAVAVVLVTGYVAFRINSWLSLFLPFGAGIIASVLGIYYLVITFKTGKTYLVGKSRKETFLSGFSTFIFMYLSMFVIISDLCLFFVKGKNHRFCLFVNGIICIAATVAVTAYAYIHKGKIKTVTYNLDVPSMDGPYRIALLSDLHTGYYVGEKELLNIAKTVNSLNSDMVVIAGDMINAGNTNECADIDAAALAIAKFKSKEGTFACTGNHDPDLRDKDFRRFIKKANINLLTDEIYNTGLFNLMGRNTCTKKRKTMEEMKPEINMDMPLFIIDHDPMGIEDARKNNADLVMCGHTHKGQVFPLNLFCRLLYSKEEFYGFNKNGKTSTVVSSGAGYFSLPMRLGTNSEVVVIDINKR